MAFNQNSNQTQDMASPPLPLITNSPMMNSHVNYQQPRLNTHSQIMSSHVNDQQPQQQQPYHVNLLPDPLSVELSQFSFELNNRRENMQEYLQLQNLQTMDSIMNEHTTQGILLHNYASRLVDLIHEKENQLVATNHANLELEKNIVEFNTQLKVWQQKALEKEATVANLNQQIEMIRESHQMMTTNESDAGSSCCDLSKDIIDSNCQMCRKEISSVVIFPCKHLCCCKTCEANLYSCPVCGIVKESSIEVSWHVKKGAA